MSGTPLSRCSPRSVKAIPDPVVRSLIVCETSTSDGSGERADPGADGDRDPGDVVSVELHLAGVEPGADLDAERPRHPG